VGSRNAGSIQRIHFRSSGCAGWGNGRVDDLPSGLAGDHVYACVRTSFSSLSSSTLILLVANGSLMSFKNDKLID
jgi:hypothetical protein